MKSIDEVKTILDRPLPSEAITQHPTKTYLSSIKAIYVTERMNEAFGVGGWQIKVDAVSTNDKGMVVVKVMYTVPQYNIYYECFGGNDNGGESSKNFDLGDAYKGATTDAITKIGSYLGIGADVFKGKSVGQTSKKSEGEKELQWLPDAKVQEAVQWAKDNGKGLADIQMLYRVNKKNQELITKLLAE